MAFPTVTVEWMPAEGPGATTGTWVSMTPYLVELTTSRGRQYEIDRFASGELNVTLRTFDRLFDPEWTAGTYYGQLVPMRQIRVTATWNAVTYDIFRGYITDWGQTAPDDAYQRTTIKARDAFVLLEQIQLPSSAWALEVQKDDPTLWFRLGETDTLRMSDSSDGGNYGLYGGSSPSSGLVANDANGAVSLDHSPDARCSIQNPNLIAAYPFTVSGLLQLDSTDPAAYHIAFEALFTLANTTTRSGGTNVFFEIAVDYSVNSLTGALIARMHNTGATVRKVYSNVLVNDGLPHHWAVVCASSSSYLIYVDGVDVTTVLTSGTPSWPGTALDYTIGNNSNLEAPFGSFGFGNGLGPSGTTTDATFGILDEICVWNGTALTAAQVAVHSLAAKSGWSGDTTGARFNRFCDAIDWPASLRDFDTGISTLGAASWSAGTNALSVMQAWADTELGAFFIGKAGEIIVRSRHYPYLNASATTSQATFGDNNGSSTLNYSAEGFSLPRDETLIRNPVAASRAGGIAVTVKDQTYIDKYGNRSWSAPNSEDLLDSAIRDRALWLLARYKELGTRLEAMTIQAHSSPTLLYPQVLGRELGERITVKRKPIGVGNETSTDQIIERISHHVTPVTWTTVFAGSPVDPNVGDYLILDDATYGLLDAGLLAY